MNRKSFLSTPVNVADTSHRVTIAPQPFSGNTVLNTAQNDKVLVLIQLIGGNDGLSSITPLASYDNLANHRGNILLKQQKLISVHGNMGWHPALKGMVDLLEQGKITTIHNVAYPNQNRSHFRSMDIWNSASPAKEQWSTGWLGRYLDFYHKTYPTGYPSTTYPDPVSISIGNIVSDTCQGKTSNFNYALTGLENLDLLAESDTPSQSESVYMAEIRFLESTIKLTNRYTERVKVAAQKGANLAVYPDANELASQLKMVARLLSGGLQTKIFVLTLGGFDTHAFQAEKNAAETGQHAVLLKTLADAINAFQNDLKHLGLEDRVLSMTYSEFGRQIMSNSAYGTDHGTAAPLFLFGSQLNTAFIGNLPVIPNKVTLQDGVPMEFDFRDVYASILDKWFGLKNENISNIFQRQHKPVNIFKATQSV